MYCAVEEVCWVNVFMKFKGTACQSCHDTMTWPNYTPRCNLKDSGNIIRRPEEALDIQSNGMVYLPHEWNIGTPTTLPSPATPPSPLTATSEAVCFFSHT